MPSRRWRRLGAAGVALWAAALIATLGILVRHEKVPAPRAASAAEEGATTSPAWRLDLYAHPRCPCTRASLESLATLATRLAHRDDVAITVHYFRPGAHADSWAHTASWRSAAELRGVSVVTDPDGLDAARVGAVASGHVTLRDATGAIVFSGGITPTRGHIGPNPGADAVLDWILDGRGAPEWPAFGCAIRNDDSALETSR